MVVLGAVKSKLNVTPVPVEGGTTTGSNPAQNSQCNEEAIEDVKCANVDHPKVNK